MLTQGVAAALPDSNIVCFVKKKDLYKLPRSLYYL